MNKTHTLAKTLITIAAAYWLIMTAVQIVMCPLVMVFNIGTSKNWFEILGMAAAYLIVQLIIVVVILQVIYRRNKIAEKIVGVEETASPRSQIEWIGFSFRLISIIAGLYCFYRAASSVGRLLIDLVIKIKMPNGGTAMDSQTYSHSILTVILLAAGIYLLCGAPHFVRWQVEKTEEMFVDTSR